MKQKKSQQKEMTVLDLLIALDNLGDMASDGRQVYIYGRKNHIPQRFQSEWGRLYPELLTMLKRPGVCDCSNCGGRPILGIPV